MRTLVKFLACMAVLQDSTLANSSEKKYTTCKLPEKQNITSICMIKNERHANGTDCKGFDNLVFLEIIYTKEA